MKDKFEEINKNIDTLKGIKTYADIQNPNNRQVVSSNQLNIMEKNIAKKLMKFSNSVKIKGLIDLFSNLSENERKFINLDTLYEHLKIEHELENKELVERLSNKGGKWNAGNEQSK
jgi:hypothetical protein